MKHKCLPIKLCLLWNIFGHRLLFYSCTAKLCLLNIYLKTKQSSIVAQHTQLLPATPDLHTLVLPALPLILFPISVPANAQVPSTWTSAYTWETKMEFLDTCFTMVQSWPSRPFGEWISRQKYLVFMLYYTSITIPTFYINIPGSSGELFFFSVLLPTVLCGISLTVTKLTFEHWYHETTLLAKPIGRQPT